MRAFVTGAGRGIGQAIALQLARDGYDLGIHVNASSATGSALIKKLTEMGLRAVLAPADFSDLAAARRCIRQVIEEWDGLDALVLSAGVSSARSLFDLDDTDIDFVVDVNLKAPLVVAQEAMTAMRDRRIRGRVVIIGSAAGQTGGALVGPHYVAAKAGTHALVKSLAKAGAPYGIRVNGIAPGFVDTDGLDLMKAAHGIDPDSQIPIGRVGSPEEIARCVSFLLSDGASYVDGALLDVNGGLVMR